MSPKRTRRRRWALIGGILALLGAIGGFLFSGWGLGRSELKRTYHLVGYWREAGGTPFDDPFSVAVDFRNGNVLVSDIRTARVVVFNRAGKFIRQFGQEGEGRGKLQRPTGVAVGPDGSVYVSDYNRDVILKYSESGEFLLEWGGPGREDHQFQSPNGISVDSSGNVYVADFQNKLVKVFDGDGRFLKIIGRPGQLGAGALDYPTDVHVTGDRLFVADAYNYRVQVFDLEGRHIASWGRHVARMIPRPAGGNEGFNVPTGVAFDQANGILHVADSANRRVVMLDAEGGFISAWSLKEPSAGHSPTMIAVSPDGSRVYATDTAGDRVIVLGVK